jgi:hypothetical protein
MKIHPGFFSFLKKYHFWNKITFRPSKKKMDIFIKMMKIFLALYPDFSTRENLKR